MSRNQEKRIQSLDDRSSIEAIDIKTTKNSILETGEGMAGSGSIDLSEKADNFEQQQQQRELNQIKIELLKKAEEISELENSIKHASADEKKQLQQEIEQLDIETAILVRQRKNEFLKKNPAYSEASFDSEMKAYIDDLNLLDPGEKYAAIQTVEELNKQKFIKELEAVTARLDREIDQILLIEKSLKNANPSELEHLNREINEKELRVVILGRELGNKLKEKYPNGDDFLVDQEIHNTIVEHTVELGNEYENIQTIAELEKLLEAKQQVNNVREIKDGVDSPQIIRAKNAIGKKRNSEGGPTTVVYDTDEIERAAKDIDLETKDIENIKNRIGEVKARLDVAHSNLESAREQASQNNETTKKSTQGFQTEEIQAKNRLILEADKLLSTLDFDFDSFLKAPKNTRKPGILSRIGGLFSGKKPEIKIGKNEMLVALQEAENWITWQLDAKPEDFEGRGQTAARSTDRQREQRGVRTSANYTRERFPRPRLDRLEEDTTRNIPTDAESDAIAEARVLESNLDTTDEANKADVRSKIEQFKQKEIKYRNALPEFIEAMGYEKSVEFSSDNASVLDFVAGEKAQFIRMIAEINEIKKGQKWNPLMNELRDVGIKSFDDYVIAAKENPKQFKEMRVVYENLKRQLTAGRSGGSATVARAKDRSSWSDNLPK